MTIKIHRPDAVDLKGFVKILTDNGYNVTFRKASGGRMMCDVEDGQAVILNERSPETTITME